MCSAALQIGVFTRSALPALGSMAVGWGLSACAPTDGQVEFSWRYVDRELAQFYPGAEKDTCEMPGRDGDGPVDFDLVVQLTMSEPDCEAGPHAESCQIMPPAHFRCDRRRGTVDAVPTTGDPYLMTVRVLVVPITRGAPFAAQPQCIASPGPRHRIVQPGHLTDLSVYQLVLRSMEANNESLRLDLEDCRDPNP